MKILDLLKDVSIDVNATCSNKDEAIDTLVSLMAKQGNLNDQDVYKQGIYAREELSTTGIGEGIARRSPQARPGCSVWRQIFRPRHPHRSSASSRRLLPGRFGRILFCGS